MRRSIPKKLLIGVLKWIKYFMDIHSNRTSNIKTSYIFCKHKLLTELVGTAKFFICRSLYSETPYIIFKI